MTDTIQINREASWYTEPFGKLLLHLEECCGGCPYCYEICASVVNASDMATANEQAKIAEIVNPVFDSRNDIEPEDL